MVRKILALVILLMFIASVYAVASSKPIDRNIEYDPQSHHFGNMLEGTTDETVFELWSCGGCGTVTYSFSWECDWVDVDPVSGSTSGEHDPITVYVDTTGLTADSYSCPIAIDTSEGVGTFMVYLNVVDNEEPKLAISPESYDFGQISEGSIEDTSFEIWNNGLGTLTYTIVEDCEWLEVSPIEGESEFEEDKISVDIDTAGLEVGIYTYDIEIQSNGGNELFTVDFEVIEGTELSIDSIRGGLGSVNYDIKNIGDSMAYGVIAAITVTGGLLGKINITSICDSSGCSDCNGTIEVDAIKTEGTEEPIFGLGKIDLVITVESDNADTIEVESSGFVLGPLVWVTG